MPKKTLYVADEDESVWKQAEELAEISISKLVSRLLKKEVEMLQRMVTLSQRMEPQLIEADDQWGARRQRFVGCWLVTEQPLGDQYNTMCAVALTRKKQFLVYFTCPHGNDYLVCPDFEALVASPKLPGSVKQAVADALGAEFIEELDV